MRENKVKRALKEGKTVIGTMVSDIRSPGIAQMLATAGFDFFVLDTEHGPFDMETVQDMAFSAKGADITLIVRVPTRYGHHNLSRPLDAGADGLLIPQVETIEEVKNIIEATRYHPLGKRGMALRRAPNNYAKGNPQELTQNVNNEVLIILQIETKSAIDHLEDLITIEGVDAVLIGPNDLSQSLGFPGQINHPLVQEYIQILVDKCNRLNFPCGIHLESPDTLIPWMEKGMRVIMCSNDINIIVDTFTNIVKRLREKVI
ncbi:MAG: aldolase/citrate lyase family protein [Dictyoglomaceae bacterium]|nr:aldolase/citrate lyase family protein [Dictyoglomaceae bacterium]